MDGVFFFVFVFSFLFFPLFYTQISSLIAVIKTKNVKEEFAMRCVIQISQVPFGQAGSSAITRSI